MFFFASRTQKHMPLVPKGPYPSGAGRHFGEKGFHIVYPTLYDVNGPRFYLHKCVSEAPFHVAIGFHLINVLLIPLLCQENLSLFQFFDCFLGIIGKFIVLFCAVNG